MPSCGVHRVALETAANCIILVVFSKSYCPYCQSTKRTLNKLDAEFQVLELDQASEFPHHERIGFEAHVLIPLATGDGSAIQDALEELTGQRTVPNIFIKQKHIGGNSDLQSLSSSGKLDALLKEAGALAV